MRRALVVAFMTTALACSGGPEEELTVDAGVPDAGPACLRDPIDASASCVKPCDVGNERLVGEFCTRGGGECDDNINVSGGALFCTIDFDEGGDSFCTRPCQEDSQCGSNARCTGDPSVDGGQKGCVPVQCL